MPAAVSLPGKGYDSQNDLFVLAKSGGELVSIAVEGKVSEPFSNETVEEWLKNGFDNKRARIQGLADILGLTVNNILPIRYQLIHRAASALLEADRFCVISAIRRCYLTGFRVPHSRPRNDDVAGGSGYVGVCR